MFFHCFLRRYALGYKEAYHNLAQLVSTLLESGKKCDEAVTILRSELEGQTAQVGDICRVVGNASQSLKSLREKDYLSRTDSGFKSYLQMKKSGLSQDQLKEDKLSPFNEQRFIKSAKEYR